MTGQYKSPRDRAVNRVPREKDAARALAAVTGAPYLHCLYTVRALRRLGEQFDLGDLAPIILGKAGPRLVGLPVDDIDIEQINEVLDLCPNLGDDVIVAPGRGNETRLLLPIVVDGARITYEHVLVGRLWPPEAWGFSFEKLATQARSQRDVARPFVVISAWPVPMTTLHLPPDDCPSSTQITEEMMSTEPAVANASVIPTPLIGCFRLFSLPDEQPTSTDELFAYQADDASGAWSGIDLPNGHMAWMHVPPT